MNVESVEAHDGDCEIISLTGEHPEEAVGLFTAGYRAERRHIDEPIAWARAAGENEGGC